MCYPSMQWAVEYFFFFLIIVVSPQTHRQCCDIAAQLQQYWVRGIFSCVTVLGDHSRLTGPVWMYIDTYTWITKFHVWIWHSKRLMTMNNSYDNSCELLKSYELLFDFSFSSSGPHLTVSNGNCRKGGCSLRGALWSMGNCGKVTQAFWASEKCRQ